MKKGSNSNKLPIREAGHGFIPEAIDALKMKHMLQTDADVAELLSVSKQMISKVRAGQASPPREMLQVLLEGLDRPLSRDDLLYLLRPTIAAIIQNHDERCGVNDMG
jgi:transcriptional regulator with XRE-family HTH domain